MKIEIEIPDNEFCADRMNSGMKDDCPLLTDEKGVIYTANPLNPFCIRFKEKCAHMSKANETYLVGRCPSCLKELKGGAENEID